MGFQNHFDKVQGFRSISSKRSAAIETEKCISFLLLLKLGYLKIDIESEAAAAAEVNLNHNYIDHHFLCQHEDFCHDSK